MNYLDEKYQLQSWVPEIFNAAYYSHELGFRKPDAAGFLTIFKEQGILANETLFIDDHLPNIQRAMNLGIQTIHKPVGVSLADIVLDNKLLIN